MKIDPYKMRERFLKLKTNPVIEGISTYNSNLVMEFLLDLEKGNNTKTTGNRSYIRIMNCKQRLVWFISKAEELYKLKKITDITKAQAVEFFNDFMRHGKIKTQNGKDYTSVADYVNVFKTFWHWYMKREEEKDITIRDITTSISNEKVKKRKFVYLKLEDVKKLTEHANYENKVLIWFLFDSGIRAPTELINVKVSDLTYLEDKKLYELKIREETAKTFGRTFKLLLSSKLLKNLIDKRIQQKQEYLFPIKPYVVNQYLKRLVKRTFKEDYVTKGEERLFNLTMYDFRHSSACYFRPKFTTEAGYKQKYAWNKDEEIQYYTKFLGMSDTIELDSMDDTPKSEYIKENENLKNSVTKMEDELKNSSKELEKLQATLNITLLTVKAILDGDLTIEQRKEMENRYRKEHNMPSMEEYYAQLIAEAKKKGTSLPDEIK